jgi:hypothetical protein
MTSEWRQWRLLAVILLLLAALALKGLLLQPPSPPASPAAGEFDTTQALARLQRILGDQRAHSVDTADNDAVRGRLTAEIAAIGLKPEVHEALDCSGFPKSRTVSCSRVRNVIAVMTGGQAPALLLNAHYDSTPTGPGAADDGIGVGTLLEVARHLRGERLARPVILLFNEGEEYGLNGAAAFVEGDPLAEQVGKLINIEARGVSGPAFMFETNEPNGPALADLKAATRRPYANSISTDFAKLIPNSTDVVKFKPKHWETLSFAITGNETRYHSPGDRIEALDRASLHHMGSEVLAASRRLAGPDRQAASGRTLFTDIGGRLLITMPLLAGALALGLIAIATWGLAVRRRAWRPVLALAIAVLAATGVAALAAVLAGLIRAGDYWRAWPGLTTLAVAATVLAVEGWLVARIASRNDRSEMRLAAWAVIVLFGAIASIALPGAIIFFVMGPALALAGIACSRRWPALGQGLAWAGAILQLIVLTELIAEIEQTLIDGPTWAVAPLVALAALPFLAETARGASRQGLAIVAAMAVVLWGAAMLAPRASAARPLAFTLDHVQDDRTGKAVWAAATKQAPLPEGFARFGPWRSQPLPYNKRVRWQAAAPLIAGPRGGLAVLANVPDGNGRRVRLKLDRGGADALLLRFDDKVPVLAMGLPGKLRTIDAAADKGPSILRCTGRSCDGLEVELRLGTPKPVTAMLAVQRFTPPPEAAPLLALRPSHAHPQYSPDSQVHIRAVRL